MLKHWDSIAWGVVLGAWCILEALGLFNPHDTTFSAIVRHYIPIWARAAIWGWLGYHFLIQ